MTRNDNIKEGRLDEVDSNHQKKDLEIKDLEI